MTGPGVVDRTPLSVPERFVVLVTYVFRACLPRTRLLVLALPCLAAVGAGGLAHLVDGSATAAFTESAAAAIFGLALPLGALVIGDAVLGAEVRSGTFAFTWLTPTRFAEIALARWFGGWCVALATLVPAVAVSALIAGATEALVPVVVGAAAGTAAHIALFVLIGALTRRAAVWSLAVVFLIERLLGAVLSSVAQLSPTWLGRNVFVGLADQTARFGRSGVPAGADGIVRLVLLAVVFLAGATFGLRRLQLTGSRD